ncbi:hypothetical protein D6D19_07389 [Aureobasidium pullulans]|uniref:BTB domain-containing protein n=1 Tax=Aureobasidium pullulans TaxID=5580 RepID=A0A4S8ZXG9_AURPU|nr:hypothetical protein D6D19_07389 [Aureobasidium pullulans]
MSFFNRLSDKIVGRPSSSRSSGDTAILLAPPNDPCSSPLASYTSVPYGLAWAPHPLSPEKNWMLSTQTVATSKNCKQAASLTVLQKMWERRELGKWDFRIKCGDWMWGVHKVVLATNSKYFEEIFLAPQPEGTYISMIELERCGKDDAGHPDRYNPKYIEEVIHFFYNFEVTQRVKEMPEYERLCFLAKVHRTATQFRATNVVKAMTEVIGDCLPKFNNSSGGKQQVSGPALTDFAVVSRWIFDQPQFPGLVWDLQLYLIEYLKENVTCLLQCKEMCAMLRDCIFDGLNKEDVALQTASE